MDPFDHIFRQVQLPQTCKGRLCLTGMPGRYQDIQHALEAWNQLKDDEIPCEMALANDTGFPYKGVIDFVDNRLNPSTGTIQVRAVFKNPMPERGQRALQPGYFARVRVPGGTDYEAFVIDDKAVQSDQAQKVVYVVDENNIVMPRPIDVGPVINGKRVVRAGLTEKDRVVINGMAKVRPGMPVQPLTEAEAAAQAQAQVPAGAPAH